MSYYFETKKANKKTKITDSIITSTLFRMGLFGAAQRWEVKRLPFPKICHTYPTMMKLGTVIPYLKEIQKYI